MSAPVDLVFSLSGGRTVRIPCPSAALRAQISALSASGNASPRAFVESLVARCEAIFATAQWFSVPGAHRAPSAGPAILADELSIAEAAVIIGATNGHDGNGDGGAQLGAAISHAAMLRFAGQFQGTGIEHLPLHILRTAYRHLDERTAEEAQSAR